MNDKATKRNYGQIRSELHDRLTTPLYPLVFAFVAIALLGHARTTRESRWAQILLAFAIALGLRVHHKDHGATTGLLAVTPIPKHVTAVRYTRLGRWRGDDGPERQGRRDRADKQRENAGPLVQPHNRG